MLVLGILNIVCGGIILLTHIFRQFDYVTHQTENLIVIFIGCLFLCTGFLLLGINFIIKTLKIKNEIVKDNNKVDKTKNSNIIAMDEIKPNQQKDEWVAERTMKLMSIGISPSDSKVRAETEYNLALYEQERKNQAIKAKQQKIEKLKKSSNGFVYNEHLDSFNSMKNTADLIEYLKSLEINDDYFIKEVLPKIEQYNETERLYGNMLQSALSELKELTNTNNKKNNGDKEIDKSKFEIITIEGKKFAIEKGGNSDIYYCPNCYTRVGSSLTICFHCNNKF